MQTLKSGNLELPKALDAEAAVLGAVMNFPGVFHGVSHLSAAMFYDPRHQWMFEAAGNLDKRNIQIDLITINQEIAAMGRSEEVTAWYITQLYGTVAPAPYVAEYACIVLQKYIQRESMMLFMKMQGQAADDTNDIADVIFEASNQLEKLMATLVGREKTASYHDISLLFYKDIQQRIDRYNSGIQTGITTGLTELNQITSGWQGSDLIVLAARPAMGKTAMALHFATSAAASGVPVVIFSLEMSKLSLYNRSLLGDCPEITAAGLKTGNVAEHMVSIDKSVDRLSKLPIYVDDNVQINTAYLRNKCRLMHKQGKCGLIIIDYLQIISSSNSKYTNREQDVSALSREAKLIAKELDVPVVLVSQLNRDVEKRPDKRPLLSDLRESGAIEQDADMVVFVHRPSYYGKTVTDAHNNPIVNAGELIIAKYRNGAIGKVKFRHNETFTRVYDFNPTQLTFNK